MEYYNVSLHGFFFMNFFSFFFPKMVFVEFFFILSWLRILFRGFFLNTVDCYNLSPHGFYFATVLPHMFFFQNYLYRICFLILSWLRIQLLTFLTCFFFHFFFAFFSKIVFFFFLCFFFRIVFIDFIFLIWSWLII
jgi:hypothetical protein